MGNSSDLHVSHAAVFIKERDIEPPALLSLLRTSTIYLMAYCDRCERWFSSDRALEQHIEDSLAHGHWPCDDCNLDFGSFYARQEHYKQSRNHHYCWECVRLFKFKESKMQHMEAKHWYCRVHDRVSNSSAAMDVKLISSYTVDLQVRSRPAVALQTEF